MSTLPFVLISFALLALQIREALLRNSAKSCNDHVAYRRHNIRVWCVCVAEYFVLGCALYYMIKKE